MSMTAGFSFPIPWQDRAGRLSWLKLACFLVAIAPGIYMLGEYGAKAFGPRPVTEAIRQSGDWTIRFLLASLAVTPLRRVLQYPKLLNVRRMLGLTALSYAGLHFALYIVDQKLDLWHVASEIVLRFYLAIAFIAFAGLCALGWTSTDGAIRRMGAQNWNRLHKLVYPIAVLVLVHFALQSKRDVTESMIMAGLFILLMLARWLDSKGRATPMAFAGLAAVAALFAALVEAGWYGLTTGVDPLRILAADIDAEMLPRPWVWVAAAGLMLALLRWWKGVKTGRER